MAEKKTRKPSQKRSIETREKIIDAGFDLICNDGYFNTDTAKIAKKAGVSTGIVYQYFKDKRDVLLAVLEKYADTIFNPILSISPTKFNKEDLPEILKGLLNNYIYGNKISAIAYKEIFSLSHYDEVIREFFIKKQKEILDKTCSILVDNGIDSTNIFEKVQLIMGIVDHLCNRIIFYDVKNLGWNIDYDVMIDLVVNEIVNLLM